MTLSSGLHSVLPMQPHSRRRICTSTLSCPVFFYGSSFLTLSGHLICKMERVRQRFIFYTQKNHTFKICLPKKPLLYLAYPKNPLVLFSQPPKNPSVFSSRPKKIPASFINPKRSLLAKISDPKKSKCRKQSLSCHTQRRRPSIKIIHLYLYFNFYYYSTKF